MLDNFQSQFQSPAQNLESELVFKFRQQYFPNTSYEEWSDWKWQLRNRYKTATQISQVLKLSQDEHQAILKNEGLLPIAITPYYMALLDPYKPELGLRKTVVPMEAESIRSEGESEDPLGEEPHRPVPAIVHRYPDRALFLVTGYCSLYCRYCTRSRLVGDSGEYKVDLKQWEKGFEYLERSSQVRDVLITGGDPLTLSDEKLEYVLSRLRRIPHIEFIRIGTKVPMVLPQRVTETLCNMLKKFHPLWMSIHVLHPDEMTKESRLACTRLADAGLPLGSQSVLLKGVNNSVEIMKKLMHELLKVRVKPYYLFHCDPIYGSSHFRTPVSEGLEIIKGLRGHTTGYAVPHYAIDIAGSGGKVALVPEYIEGKDGNDLLVRNYAGELYRYPDAIQN